MTHILYASGTESGLGIVIFTEIYLRIPYSKAQADCQHRQTLPVKNCSLRPIEYRALNSETAQREGILDFESHLIPEINTKRN